LGEFFILLFGGTYLLYKYISWKNNNEKFDNERREENKRLDAFNNLFSYNGAMLSAMFKDGRIVADEVYEVIGEDLRELYGDDYKRIVPLPGTPWYNFAHNRYQKVPTGFKRAYSPIYKAEVLWTSKQGKVVFQYGDDLDWFCVGKMQMFPDEKPFEVINNNIALFKKAESNLRNAGVNIMFVGMPGKHRNGFLNNNVETRIAIYERLNTKEKQISKRLW